MKVDAMKPKRLVRRALQSYAGTAPGARRGPNREQRRSQRRVR